MKPYFDVDGITIYLGNCLDVLPTLDQEIDCVIADPPYGTTDLPWDQLQTGWLNSAAEMLKPSGSMWIFGTLKIFVRDRDLFADQWKLIQDVIWEKHNGSNAFNDRFRNVHESVVHFHLIQTKWRDVYHKTVMTNDATQRRTLRRKTKTSHWSKIGSSTHASYDGGPRLMRSVIRARSGHGGFHPTQKPISLVRSLIEYSCPGNGIVLDPFMGVGTTLLAAKALGLRAVGIECNQAYCDTAIERLRQEVLFT